MINDVHQSHMTLSVFLVWCGFKITIRRRCYTSKNKSRLDSFFGDFGVSLCAQTCLYWLTSTFARVKYAQPNCETHRDFCVVHINIFVANSFECNIFSKIKQIFVCNLNLFLQNCYKRVENFCLIPNCNSYCLRPFKSIFDHIIDIFGIQFLVFRLLQSPGYLVFLPVLHFEAGGPAS